MKEKAINTTTCQDKTWALDLQKKGVLRNGILCIAEKDLGNPQYGGLYMAMVLITKVTGDYFIDETGRCWEAAEPVRSIGEVANFLIANYNGNNTEDIKKGEKNV